ncbi:hypothetical protein [Alkalicoccus urumqiensis]|uniref:Uncharacterized protein n=1 Tax=Alkalicoccus urumqiensis TaxID=1548213 RepID=A0A2P6ME57_ALKUR|nr:hypothetical protein [Alkalicoccus urumqiensis]PRO64568.1 hypothetical protein C6I21_13800 [Alkalicoccus urumqiensis]
MTVQDDQAFRLWCKAHNIPFEEVTHRHHFYQIELRNLTIALMQGKISPQEMQHGREFLLARLIRHYHPPPGRRGGER